MLDQRERNPTPKRDLLHIRKFLETVCCSRDKRSFTTFWIGVAR